MIDPHQKLTPTEAGKLLARAPATLASERSRGTGLPYVKLNGKVYYLRSDVEAYIAQHTTRHETREVQA